MSCAHLRLDLRLVAGRTDEGRIDQRVEHVRGLRDRVGEPRRGAEEVGEEQAQAVVGLQDGEELDGGRHAAEGAVEGGERPVRIGGAAERGKKRRDVSSVRTSRARALTIAGRRPKCQPRTVSAADLRPGEAEPLAGWRASRDRRSCP